MWQVGRWWWVVGVSYILYSIRTDLGTLVLQRKLNSKTPNIYIANIVNKIGLLWNSFLKVPHCLRPGGFQGWKVAMITGVGWRPGVGVWKKSDCL